MTTLPDWARAKEIKREEQEKAKRIKQEAREARAAERAMRQVKLQVDSQADNELYHKRGPRSKNWAPGDVFGRLTLQHVTGHDSGRRPLIQCICECGAQPIIRLDHILNGGTISCGCAKENWIDRAKLQHLAAEQRKSTRNAIDAMLEQSYTTLLHEARNALTGQIGNTNLGDDSTPAIEESIELIAKQEQHLRQVRLAREVDSELKGKRLKPAVLERASPFPPRKSSEWEAIEAMLNPLILVDDGGESLRGEYEPANFTHKLSPPLLEIAPFKGTSARNSSES